MGLRCLAVCIICIFGPVDLPSLIGSSSTAEPLTAMLELEHPTRAHHSPVRKLTANPCLLSRGGNMLGTNPPQYRMNVWCTTLRSVYVCTHIWWINCNARIESSSVTLT